MGTHRWWNTENFWTIATLHEYSEGFALKTKLISIRYLRDCHTHRLKFHECFGKCNCIGHRELKWWVLFWKMPIVAVWGDLYMNEITDDVFIQHIREGMDSVNFFQVNIKYQTAVWLTFLPVWNAWATWAHSDKFVSEQHDEHLLNEMKLH